MDPKEDLLKALRSLPPSEWTGASIEALAQPSARYTGRSHRASTAAGHLAEIYKMRLEHARRTGLKASGMPELLEALEELPPDEPVDVEPFDGDAEVVVACYARGRLLCCITIERHPVHLEVPGASGHSAAP